MTPALVKIQIWAHHHTKRTNEGDRFVIELEGESYFGQHRGWPRRPVPRSSVDRLQRFLDQPPVLEPDPDLPGQPERSHWIPLIMLRVHTSDGKTRQFRTESLEYLMLPWEEVETQSGLHVTHYGPDLSLAVATLMPLKFLNRDCLLAGCCVDPLEVLTDREKIARALYQREISPAPPRGPLADVVRRADLEGVRELLASGLRPSLELLEYARTCSVHLQIEEEALREIQSARSPAQVKEWDDIFRQSDHLFEDWSPPRSPAECSQKIAVELQRVLEQKSGE